MKTEIVLRPRELSEAYALMTLHDHLAEHRPEYSACYVYEHDNQIIRGLIKDHHQLASSIEDRLVIGVYSDCRGGGMGQNSLEIDVCLLKNCAQPLSEEYRHDLRKKYNISTDRPVLVIGQATGMNEEMQLISRISKKADVYVIGAASGELPKIGKKNAGRVHAITEYGVLRDYFAMADISVLGNTLWKRNYELNNFVEATEGGPLFMVSPGKEEQYGFSAMVDRGLIRICRNINELVEDMSRYVDAPDGIAHRENRRSHIQETRDTYLPLIVEVTDTLFDAPQGRPLELIRAQYPQVRILKTDGKTIIMHEETRWGIGSEMELFHLQYTGPV